MSGNSCMHCILTWYRKLGFKVTLPGEDSLRNRKCASKINKKEVYHCIFCEKGKKFDISKPNCRWKNREKLKSIFGFSECMRPNKKTPQKRVLHRQHWYMLKCYNSSDLWYFSDMLCIPWLCCACVLRALEFCPLTVIHESLIDLHAAKLFQWYLRFNTQIALILS